MGLIFRFEATPTRYFFQSCVRPYNSYLYNLKKKIIHEAKLRLKKIYIQVFASFFNLHIIKFSLYISHLIFNTRSWNKAFPLLMYILTVQINIQPQRTECFRSLASSTYILRLFICISLKTSSKNCTRKNNL